MNFVLFFALLLLPLVASAQHTRLMLQKQDARKNAFYEVGDELIYYREGKRSKTKDRIVAFEDSMIVFYRYRLPVSQITALHIDNKTRWWLRFKLSQLSLLGGAGYLFLNAVNGQGVDRDALVVGGSLHRSGGLSFGC